MSVYLGNLKGWGGDEWFSYRDFTIIGAPFAILTKIQIYFLGPLSKHNFILFKMQGLVWLAILFLFLLKMHFNSKNYDAKYFILFTILFITLNPLLIEQTQFFRYYNLYTLSAFSVYFLIRQRADDFGKNRKLFYGVLAISPFFHLFLFWSLFSFLFFKEVSILIKNRRWIIVGLLSIFIIVIALNIELLLVNG